MNRAVNTFLACPLLASIATLLVACAQNAVVRDTNVDRLSLLKSMMYTNQHLVEIGFGDRDASEQRKLLLLQSFCDLERRDMLDVDGSPKQCRVPVDTKALACITQFHRCIGTCDDMRQNCSFCERKGLSCLSR